MKKILSFVFMNEDMEFPKTSFVICREGGITTVNFLVEEGADIEAKNNEGHIPLVWASCCGYLEIVEFIVDKGADIEAKDEHGHTPLIIASEFGHIKVVKFLIERGADIEAKDNDGYTPLITASMFGHNIEVVKFLIEKGADIEAKNNRGETFYDYLNNKEEIDLLLKDIEERKRMIKPCSFLATCS